VQIFVLFKLLYAAFLYSIDFKFLVIMYLMRWFKAALKNYETKRNDYKYPVMLN